MSAIATAVPALPARGHHAAARPSLRTRLEEAGARFTYWLDFEQRRWDAARAAHGDVPAGAPLEHTDPTEETR